MFPNKEDEVIELSYTNNEFKFPKLNSKKNKSVIRSDISCEIKTIETNKLFLMDIEMKIEKN